MTGHEVLALLIAVLTSTIVCGTYLYATQRYRALEFRAHERIMQMHVAQRRRAWLGVARSQVPVGLLLRAEGVRGYVWSWITPCAPTRGMRPQDCHDETLGWALTKLAARRQLDARREALSSARR